MVISNSLLLKSQFTLDSIPTFYFSNSNLSRFNPGFIQFCRWNLQWLGQLLYIHDLPQVVQKRAPNCSPPRGVSIGDLAALRLPRTLDRGGGARQTLRRGSQRREISPEFLGQKITPNWEVSGQAIPAKIEKAIYSGFTHWKWWFSIAMLIYQRVFGCFEAGESRRVDVANMWVKLTKDNGFIR